MKLLQEIGTELAEDEAFKDGVAGPFEVFGVQDLADSSVNIRTRLKTKAGRQWSIRREFLRRVKRRFDAEGIEIPFPHQTLYFGADKNGGSPPAHILLCQAQSRRSGNVTISTPLESQEFFETSDPEMDDAETARNMQKDSLSAESSESIRERAEVAKDAKQVQQDSIGDEAENTSIEDSLSPTGKKPG